MAAHKHSVRSLKRAIIGRLIEFHGMISDGAAQAGVSAAVFGASIGASKRQRPLRLCWGSRGQLQFETLEARRVLSVSPLLPLQEGIPADVTSSHAAPSFSHAAPSFSHAAPPFSNAAPPAQGRLSELPYFPPLPNNAPVIIPSGFWGTYQKAIVAGDPNGSPADSPSNRIDPNSADSIFAGVGSLSISTAVGTYICSGTLISPLHVLTAAHCMDINNDGGSDVSPGNVKFYLNAGASPSSSVVASDLSIHPDFTGFANPVVNDDIAIVTLSSPAPSSVPVYRYSTTPFDQVATTTLVGYGTTGDGVNGYQSGTASFTTKRTGQNRADAGGPDDNGSGRIEIFEWDFDGPSGTGLTGGTTLGNEIETTVGGGDSGGPSFIDDGAGGQILFGVNTYTYSASDGPDAPLFGSGGGGMVVGAYLDFISNTLQFDFGDAPDTGSGTGPGNYRTLHVSDGPRHIATGPILGAARGSETDANMAGDSGDDGVAISDLTIGAANTITVTSSGGGAKLDYFFDWNGNGSFEDVGEAFSTTLNNEVESITITPPPGTPPGTTYARFRISSEGGLSSAGLAYDGEVEDYQINLLSTATTVSVTTLSDVVDATDGVLSLREAVIQANNTAGDFIIELGAGSYTLSRTGAGEDLASTGDLDILANGAVTIVGVEADQTTIDASGLGDRVFQVFANASLTIEGVTINGGNAVSTHGGGILNAGSLTVLNSTISSNAAQNGGGIYNSGTALVRSSTLSGNTAQDGAGLAHAGGTFAVFNSTLSANSATRHGGGIHVSSPGLTVGTSTIFGNRARSTDPGGNPNQHGGGIRVASGGPIVHNTIIAGNVHGSGNGTASDINGNVNANSSFNLIGTGGSGGLSNGTGGNLVGINPATVLDPILSDNGGPTLTHAVIAGSPAINAGDPSFNPAAFHPPLITDQRGFTRVADSLKDGTTRIDIGAVEVQPPGTLEATLVSGTLRIVDMATGGAANQLTISRSGDNLVIRDAVEPFASAPEGSTLSSDRQTLSIAIATVTALNIELAGGDDAATVVFSSGNPIPTGGLSYDGGTGNNDLTLIQGDFHTTAFAHSGVGVGNIQLAADDSGSALSTITYVNVAPITSALNSQVIELHYGSGDETITVSNAGGGSTRAVGSLAATTTFTHPTRRLEIVASGGADVVNVNSLASDYVSLTIRGDDTSDQVHFNGPLTFAADHGLHIADMGTARLSNHASISAIGSGAISIAASTNIDVSYGSSIATVDGDIFLSSNRQEAATSGDFVGIEVALATIASTGAGNIHLSGRGGTVGGNQQGVLIYGGSFVRSGNGSLTIEGTGGASSGESNHGVRVLGANTRIASDNGMLLVRGVGGGGSWNNVGVHLSDSAIVSANTDIDVIGTGGSGTSSFAIGVIFDAQIVAAANANVSLVADSINLESAIAIRADESAVAIRPLTAATTINLGGSDVLSGGPLTLGLTNAELSRVVARSLTIGDTDSGAITLTTAINRAVATDVNLISGGSIVFGAGSIDTAGGALTLAPGIDVQPARQDVDATASAVSFAPGSALRINIGGLAVDTQYWQLNVAGAVDLTGTHLALTGTLPLSGGESFKIVNNGSAASLVGQFSGLSEGALINNFLDSGLDATITYVGGDGNDVVLTVAPEPTIFVTTFADAIDPDDGLISLREAIIMANGSSSDVTIVLGVGTYSLTLQGADEDAALTGDLDVLAGGSVRIVGAGANQAMIDASGLVVSGTRIGDRVFHVLADASLRLEDLRVSGGQVPGDGGGILNFGLLHLERVDVRDNTASFGGGIRSSSTTTIVDSSFSGNRANGGGGGAILQAAGSLSISGSTLSDNRANYGGGLRNFGVATVTHSHLTGNTSVFDGGGIADSGTMDLRDVTISGNAGRNGGGIWNVGNRLVVTRGTLTGNSADFGGGIWSRSPTTIVDSTFTDNTAISQGGAILKASGASLTINGSTLVSNSANFGGSLMNFGSTDVINSTFSQNHAITGGGAIFNWGSLTIRHSTLFGNRADSNGNGSGQGGAIRRNDGLVTLHNTIVAGNLLGTGEVTNDISTDVSFAGSYNLIGDAGSSGGLTHGVSGNIVGQAGTGIVPADAVLATTLADNGGPTLTHALIAGSPAIDAGDATFDADVYNPPLLFDQRGEGFARISGTRLDIGAFEVQLTNAPPVLSLPSDPVALGEGQWISLSEIPVTVSDVDAGTGNLTMTFELPAGAEFQQLEGPTQGLIEMISPQLAKLTGTLSQLNQSDLSLVRLRVVDAVFDTTVQMNVHVSDNGNTGSPGEPAVTDSGHVVFEVSNVAPTLALIADQTATASTPLTINGSFSDPSLVDHPWTIEVDWNGNGFVVAQIVNVQGDFSISNTYTTAGSYLVRVRVIDKDGGVSNVQTFNVEVAARVVGRHVFYNSSAWDGNGALVANADNAAIATDKTALLPDRTATFSNYISYSRGINGIFIDIQDLATAPILSNVDDFFQFRVGNDSNPAGWSAAPTPTSVGVLVGEGVGGVDRIYVTWQNGAILKQWLQVIVKGGSATGLAQRDVHYWGNTVGETGNSLSNAHVNSTDVLLTNSNQSGFSQVTIVNTYDFNRDKSVNSTDVLIANANQSGFTPLNLFTAAASDSVDEG